MLIGKNCPQAKIAHRQKLPIGKICLPKSPYSHDAFIYGIAEIIIESSDTHSCIALPYSCIGLLRDVGAHPEFGQVSAPIRTLDMHIQPMDTVFRVLISGYTHPFSGYAHSYSKFEYEAHPNPRYISVFNFWILLHRLDTAYPQSRAQLLSGARARLRPRDIING